MPFWKIVSRICCRSYYIELNAAVKLDEWNKTIGMMLEEDGYLDKNGFRYIDGRQTEIYTVPRKIEYVR